MANGSLFTFSHTFQDPIQVKESSRQTNFALYGKGTVSYFITMLIPGIAKEDGNKQQRHCTVKNTDSHNSAGSDINILSRRAQRQGLKPSDWSCLR
ncbi:hypothetical protein JRQ81_018268 [Phrynocephalus forsythii]|uniref:Uncharacterized protein n=1 Tax=Phrynocephalus forsythii TaxID=171643 RepID=A0A9Q0XSI7_9SAUR|nr:hypothetical protein JRQ81_018268 [Phrynocephalus forsythii]